MKKNDTDPVVLIAKRTPHGSFLGSYSSLSASDLSAMLIKRCLAEKMFLAENIHGVVMGCVLTAGLGQAPARQGVLKSGLFDTTPGFVVNRVCGSGMAAVVQSCLELQHNDRQIFLAGGMESMSQAPHLTFMRLGQKLGHRSLIDHMLFDGLEDAQQQKMMGCFAEELAASEKITRKAQDTYTLQSLERVLSSENNGCFEKERVSLPLKKGFLKNDEPLQRVQPAKVESLKPVFSPQGTVTAASSSGLADGASILALSSFRLASKKGLKPMAFIRGWASFATTPKNFTVAPVGAVEMLLKKLAWHVNDVDLWEVNEAFAVVPMAFMRFLKIPSQKVNVCGGSLGLGHPLGSSGSRIIVTLLHALEARQQKKGIAAICIGGGEGLAIAVERP